MTVEGWKSFFEVGGLILLLLTFVFGAGTVFFTKKLNTIQARELREFRIRIEHEGQKTAEAQTEAAKAQLALQTYLGVVAKSVNSRFIDPRRFADLLKGVRKGTVEIWYNPSDEEARFFALQLEKCLLDPSVGWEAKVRPFPDARNVLTRQADLDGMAIEARQVPLDINSSLHRLENAIRLSVGGWNISGLEVTFGKPALPDDYFILAIGRHRVDLPMQEVAKKP